MQFGSRSSISTAAFLTFASGIASAFNRYDESSRAVALDIPKAFDRVWYGDLLHKLKSYGFSAEEYGLILSFLSNRGLQVLVDGKLCTNIYLMLVLGSIRCFTLFLLYITDLLDDVISNVAVYACDTTLCVIRHLISGNN